MKTAATHFDVAVLGSGIGGSLLATILAKQGLSVLLLEESVHPRFAIGESLIPETGIRLRILGEKHGIPEIGWLGNFYQLRDHVSPACGVKRSFSFMYHRAGEAHRAGETSQLPTLTPPFGPDAHLYRQEVDAFMAHAAVRYGAHFRQQCRIDHVDLGDDRVDLHLSGGERLSARFLVDAGGMRSHVSTQLGLRDAVPRFKTDTRVLYTHMLGVPPADVLTSDRSLPSPLGQATMHHVFDGGWMWIIPFSNHRESTNPLTSVGLLLDRRQHPEPQGHPEQEFRRIISRYPTIARHFADATAVRPWIGSGRLQYSQARLAGHRWIQLPHAASFVDPLYSSGMSVLTVAVDLIADALIPALADNAFDRERFQRIEDVVNTGFDHYDQIIRRSFDAFRSFELWNAWNRNWMMGNFLGTFGPLAMLVRYLSSGDASLLAQTTAPGRIGVLGSHLPAVVAAMQASSDDIGAALAGTLSDQAAAEGIFARLGQLDFLPPYMGFGKPEQHAPASFTLPQGARHVLWYRRHNDPFWRDYCDFPLLGYARQALGFMVQESSHNRRRSRAAWRDVWWPGNDEWRQPARAMAGLPEPKIGLGAGAAPDEGVG